jgi:hypothetical protein
MPRFKKLSLVSFLVYGAVILLLFFLAFFSRGFSLRVGDVRISGRYAPLPLVGERKLSDLSVSYQGLTLSFSRRLPVSVDSAFSYGLDTLESFSNQVDILYEGGTRVIITGGNNGSYTLSLKAVDAANPRLFELAIPFAVKGGSEPAGDSPVLTWQQGGKTCLLTMSDGCRIDSHANRLLLSGGSGTPLTVILSAVEASLDSPYAAWLSREASAVTTENLRTAISDFEDWAYAGWTRRRLSPDGTLWRMPDGSFSFDDELASCLLSESIPRGTYAQSRALIQRAQGRRRGQSLLTDFMRSASPFIGNIAGSTREVEASAPAEIQRLQGILQSRDISLLHTPYPLIPFSLDHGSFSLVQDILSFLQNCEPSKLDGPSTAAILETLLDYNEYVMGADSVGIKCREITATVILPSIKKTSEGFFLAQRGGSSVDVGAGMRVAALLRRAGSELTLGTLDDIGRCLLASSLGLEKNGDFLPATLKLSQDRVASREGSIPPEQVYRFIASDRRLPKETPLYKAIGPNAWIWSAADVEEVAATPESLGIILSFPVKIPHYILVKGVKRISRIALHGQQWRSDPGYDMYSDGWAYDAESASLFIKLTGREERERIEITY